MRMLLLTSLTMIAFAANSVLNRMALADGAIDPMVFGAVRVLAGAAVLAALLRWRDGAVGLRVAGRVIPVAALVVYVFGFSAAYVALDAGFGALVLFGMVQVTMFAGAFLRREPVPMLRWIGAGLAFCGLIALLAPGPGQVAAGHLALMALAGIGWGIYSLAGRGEPDALRATAANFILAVPVALAIALIWADPAAAITLRGVALALLSGAVTSGLGYALGYTILPELGAARGAVAQLTVPVIAATGGLLLLAEVPTLRFVLAAMLVLGGVALSLMPGRRRG